MLKYIFILLCLTKLHCFNVSKLNEFTKNNVISGASKISNLLLLKKTHNYLNDSNDEKTSHMESHSLENNLYFYSPVDQESSLLLEQKIIGTESTQFAFIRKISN